MNNIETMRLALEAYLCREMPAGTIIGDPKWWVPKIANAIHKALAQQEQAQPDLKLMPRNATEEMLKAMDECSTEGYDERLYAGHASSVYTAAWDAFHSQAIEQAQKQEPVTIWYMRDNHTFKKLSEDVSTALIEIEQEFNEGHTYGMLCSKRKGFPSVHASGDKKRLEFFAECKATLEQWLPKTSPPPRQPLTDEQISNLWDGHTVPVFGKTGINPIVFARAIEVAHGIKGEA